MADKPKLFAVMALLVLLFAGSVRTQEPLPGRMPQRVVPVDEGVKDESFAEYRRQLLEAIRSRDIKRVLPYVSADVRATLDGKKGIAALSREWNFRRSPRPFLNELERVVTLGGRLGTCYFVAPYPYTETSHPRDMVDYVFVTSDAAPVHSRPDSHSDVIVSASYDVFRYDAFPDGWMKVTLHDGRVGYIQDRFVRSPADPHAIFGKIVHEWKLVSFYGGVDW